MAAWEGAVALAVAKEGLVAKMAESVEAGGTAIVGALREGMAALEAAVACEAAGCTGHRACWRQRTMRMGTPPANAARSG